VCELGLSTVTLFTMKDMKRLGIKSADNVVLSTCLADWDEITSRQTHQSRWVYNEYVVVFLCYFLFSVSLFKYTHATALNVSFHAKQE